MQIITNAIDPPEETALIDPTAEIVDLIP